MIDPYFYVMLLNFEMVEEWYGFFSVMVYFSYLEEAENIKEYFSVFCGNNLATF